MADYCGRIHVSDQGTLEMKRRAERIEDRIDIAVCAYVWASGEAAYPWTTKFSLEECKKIRERVKVLARVANGHGDVEILDARDEAAMAVLSVLSLKKTNQNKV